MRGNDWAFSAESFGNFNPGPGPKLDGNNHGRPSRDFPAWIRHPAQDVNIRTAQIERLVTEFANQTQSRIRRLPLNLRPAFPDKPFDTFQIGRMIEETDESNPARFGCLPVRLP